MKARLISGVCLIALASFTIIEGRLWFFSLMFLSASFCIYEVMKMRGYGPLSSATLSALSLNVALFLSLQIPEARAYWAATLSQTWVVFLIALALLELLKGKVIYFKQAYFSSLFTALYFSPLFAYIYLFRTLNDGLFQVAFCISVIVASDVFALFGGRCFGKTPLSSISPKKTVEGSIIGLLCGGLIALIYAYFIGGSLIFFGLKGLGIAGFSQLGDLHESLVKRHFKVKDSSRLIPGHGGFYDRADSIIFVLPLIYILFN